MRFFDKTFFKFLLGFVILLICGLFFISKVGAQTSLVNINTASSAELQTLNGIGPSKAQAIIDYRTQNGPFQKIEDIKNVSGIGDATYNNIKDFITVGSQNTNTATNNNQITQTTQQTQTDSGGSSAVTKTLSVDAGVDKTGVVGQPLEFRAETNTDSASFTWIFGDGGVAYGKVVTHVYSFAGEYVVILKASLSGLSDSSRIDVKIVPDTLSVTFASAERIEISNTGKDEINLSGRWLRSGGKVFTFPEDTIIKAGQKVSFPSSVTGLTPIGNVGAVLSMETRDVPSKIFAPTDNQVEVEKITQRILSLQRQLIDMKGKQTISEINNMANVVLATNSSTSESTSDDVKSGWLQTLKKFFGFK